MRSPTEISPTPAAGDAPTAELAADLARLRDLIANAPIRAARAFVRELEQRWPESDEVQHFARVLAPPIVRNVSEGKQRARNLEPELEWLREHAAAYPGCWLALQGGRLLGSNRDLKALLAEIREIPGSDSALLHFEPRPREPR